MSSLVKGLFGDKQSSQTVQRLDPIRINIGTNSGSRLVNNNGRGTVTLPDEINAARDELMTGFGSLLDRVRGKNSAFVQAAVNPVIERLSGVPAAVQRGFSRRGVFGSIPQAAITNAEIDTARAIGDATLNAEQQGMATEAAVMNNMRALTQDFLAQELQSLGLSQNAVNSVISSQLPVGQTNTAPNDGSGIGNLLFNIGSVFKQ